MILKPSPLIFLLGCPRSGTTLLQSMLAAHPQIASFRETKFFEYLVPLYEPKRHALGIASRQLNTRLETYFKDEINHPELIQCLPKVAFMGHYTHRFFKILRILAKKQGKSILLEKTPHHIYHIDQIERNMPNALFIHLLRNGADVVASLYEVTHKYPKFWGGFSWDIDFCLNQWIEAVNISLSRANKSNHILVNYEKMLEFPQGVLMEICDFIGVDFRENMLVEFAEVAKDLVLDQEGRSIKNELKTNNPSKFYTIFEERQRMYILDQISAAGLDQLV